MTFEMMTVKEVAAYLRVHTDMIYGLVKLNKIPHVRVGNRILFTKEAIQAWVRDQEERSLQSVEDDLGNRDW